MSTDKVSQQKDIQVNFVARNHLWIIYAGILDKDCKEVCAACNKNAGDDYRERIYNYVFRTANENFEKVNSGYQKSIFQNYEKFNMLIVLIEKDFSLIIMMEKDFNNLNMIYDLAKTVEQKSISFLEINPAGKETMKN